MNLAGYQERILSEDCVALQCSWGGETMVHECCSMITRVISGPVRQEVAFTGNVMLTCDIHPSGKGWLLQRSREVDGPGIPGVEMRSSRIKASSGFPTVACDLSTNDRLACTHRKPIGSFGYVLNWGSIERSRMEMRPVTVPYQTLLGCHWCRVDGADR